MIPVSRLHIEPTNICTLKCAGCARTRFIQQWSKHWKNHTLDINDLVRFIDRPNLLLNFCGNYGDPIYHPKFIEMITAVKNQGHRISITTNGSYRTPTWWKDLCDVLDKNDSIRFSIDGTPESFLQYRENADWQSIKKGIEICVNASVRTTWKFIPFSFNQHQIDEAKQLSHELGIDEFLIDPSDRFDEKTQHLIPVDDLVGSRKHKQDQVKQDQKIDIDPKCHSGKEHFIAATGHYAPCCFVADHRFYYKTDFGKNKSRYDIKTFTLSQILDQQYSQEFFVNILQNPPSVCQFNCPKV